MGLPTLTRTRPCIGRPRCQYIGNFIHTRPKTRIARSGCVDILNASGVPMTRMGGKSFSNLLLPKDLGILLRRGAKSLNPFPLPQNEERFASVFL
jgi:hypothetical protein